MRLPGSRLEVSDVPCNLTAPVRHSVDEIVGLLRLTPYNHNMTARQVGGTALIVAGLIPVGWAVKHRGDPLVAAHAKLGEPTYYGRSLQLIAFTMGLGAV